MEQAMSGAPKGLVAYAHSQTSGQGRLDRRWKSPADASFSCSILLRAPGEPYELRFGATAVAPSARAAIIRFSSAQPDLKRPNDLIVGNAKLAELLNILLEEPEPSCAARDVRGSFGPTRCPRVP
jgi:BirA family biotin operon repressor/biotin-[acetyl-CoA-carboxylase] ligase